jgi:hypothetical protein
VGLIIHKLYSYHFKHSLAVGLFILPIHLHVDNPWNYVALKDIPAQVR